jgi:BirA family biotin operon repressor/biotin-[acetyl-CoA-carboxylase] ligase
MVPRPGRPPIDLLEALEHARPRLGRLATSVTYFPTIGSTNDVAAAMASLPDAEGAVVLADAQTAGRGRRGHTWFSPPGAGLYVSVILLPARAARVSDRATGLVTLAAGVALCEGVEAATGLVPEIKWPNDVLVGRRKLAGILAEGVAAPSAPALQSVVLGFGINVGTLQPPRELADRVTSLELELGRPIERWAVAVETLAALAARYRDLLDARFDAILDAWRHRSPRSRGTHVTWDDGRRRGVTAGIDEAGALLVRDGERLERIVSGEVLWTSQSNVPNR